MTTITLWLLLAVSDGLYNRGITTVVEKFATEQDCKAAQLAAFPPKMVSQVIASCVPVKAARP